MEIADRLSRALGERYELREEVGSGATAIVFQAIDRRHKRPVALKVLRPDVAEAVGADRFLQEIEISSRLTHPHILPLYDSGQADGLLYFVMPFIEGESLRDLMERDGPLALGEAIEITEQVAAALEYAHEQGILHRDVKPENIMLSRGQAFLADLGIARAMGEAGTDQLTRTGLAVGTPLYMSPEQAAGEKKLDGRADLYSLACVLFEMLAGEPPFTGPTSQAILAKHALETVPSLRVLRASLSPSMDRVVRRALEKTPVDRFATAAEFASHLRQAYTDTLQGVDSVGWTGSSRRRRFRAAGVLGSVALGALAFWLFTQGPWFSPRELDPTSVVVLPFSIDPGVDPAPPGPAFLTEAVSTRFNGEGGPRAVSTDSVLRAWEGAGGAEGELLTRGRSLQVAEEVSAGLVLTGRIRTIGEGSDPAGEVLDAWVLSVPEGRELARVEDLRWSEGAVNGTLDQLAICVLVQLMGEDRALPDLMSRELEVVRDYLEGLRHYRGGRYTQALDRFQESLGADSTFALAGLAMLRVAEAGPAGADEATLIATGRAVGLALRHDENLPATDSAHFHAILGSSYPETTDFSRQIWNWDRIVVEHDDDGLASYFHGKIFYLWGGVTPNEAHLSRARQALLRALEIRPGFVPAQEILLDVAGVLRDSAEVVRMAEAILRRDPPTDAADYARWRLAVATGDATTRAQLRSRFADFPRPLLERILGSAQLTGQGLEDALAAAEAHRAGSTSRPDRYRTSFLNRTLALNLGRPQAAAALETDEPYNFPINNLLYVIEAAFFGGDEARAEIEIEESRAMLREPGRSRFANAMDRCTLALWNLAAGDTIGAAAAVDSLRLWTPASQLTNLTYICAALVDVRKAMVLGSPELRASADALDLLVRVGPELEGHVGAAANLTLARAYESLGEHARALEAARRRPLTQEAGPVGLATMLREEGRLAAHTGDRQGALAAFRHYLALRFEPEEGLRAAADSVRREVARLESGMDAGE